MDDPLKTALATFVAQGGVISAPASDSDIAAANAELAAHDCPELPPDYVAFLKQADGAACNRLVLYPLGSAEERAYWVVQATIKERKDNYHDRCHVLGHFYNTFMLVVRDWATGEYRLHDEDGSLMFRFENFETMLGKLSVYGNRRTTGE